MQVSLKKYAKVSPGAFGLRGRKTIAIVRSSGNMRFLPSLPILPLLLPSLPPSLPGLHGTTFTLNPVVSTMLLSYCFCFWCPRTTMSAVMQMMLLLFRIGTCVALQTACTAAALHYHHHYAHICCCGHIQCAGASVQACAGSACFWCRPYTWLQIGNGSQSCMVVIASFRTAE